MLEAAAIFADVMNTVTNLVTSATWLAPIEQAGLLAKFQASFDGTGGFLAVTAALAESMQDLFVTHGLQAASLASEIAQGCYQFFVAG